jgi:hypothetical protein
LLLFGIGNSLWVFDTPGSGASTAELLRFYDDKSTAIQIGVSLGFAATALFLYFAAGLRALLDRYDPAAALSTTAFAGALVAAVAGLASQAINLAAATRAGDAELTGSFARSGFETARTLGFNVTAVGFGVLLLAIAVISLRSRAIMPRWLAWLSIFVGIALLTPIGPAAMHPAVLLVIAVSVLVIRAPEPEPG